MLRKIISGGQTGADRAGLDFAIEAGLEPHARVQAYRLRSVLLILGEISHIRIWSAG